MTPIELKKLKVELMRVQAARAELELRIDERMEEIQRVKENIEIQLKKEAELESRIEENK
jgi:hypothetical protein